MPQPSPQQALPGDVAQASTLFGRGIELRELGRQLDLARAGQGGLVMLTGEAGIGKTSTAREGARRAEEAGFSVLWGRCWEGDGAPAYWPWAQVVGTSPGVAVRSERLDAPGARFELFEAVTAHLTELARASPLLIVLDDLHCADEPSLLLLRFLARGLHRCRILAVGTYRDVGAAGERVSALLGNLAGDGRRLRLEGLGREDVSRIIAMVAGTSLDEAVVTAVAARTEGNPFFVHEVARLIAGGHAHDSLPPGVREMVAARLGALPGPSCDVLGAAAVLGVEVDVAQLHMVSDGDVPAALDTAVGAGVLRPLPGDGARFRFSHALVREAVYDSLPPARRMALHARAAEALEPLAALDPGGHAAAVAHHFRHAPPWVYAGKAIEYAVQAGDAARDRLGYEEAAGQYERALHLAELHTGDLRLAYRLLMAAGDLRSRAGELDAARSHFLRAAALARRVGAPELVARAALGVGARFISLRLERTLDAPLIALLEEALAAVGPGDGGMRALLLARLSRALYYSDLVERRAALAQEALLMARRVGHAGAEVAALHATYWARWEPESARARLEAAAGIVHLAQRGGDPEMEMQGRHLWLLELAGQGSAAATDDGIAIYCRLADQLGQPVYRWYALLMRAGQALRQGRFAEGERVARAGLELGERVGIPIARRSFAGQMFWPLAEQGRVAEIADDLSSAGSGCGCVTCRAALGVAALVDGRVDEAGGICRALADGGLGDLPRRGERLAALTSLAQLVAGTADAPLAGPLRSLAEDVYRLLAPSAGRHAQLGLCASWGGSASHHLGLLAVCLGRWEAAESHFETALAEEAVGGCPPWRARTQLAHAACLARSPSAGKAERAFELATSAQVTAAQLGMSVVGGEAARLLRALTGGAASRIAGGRDATSPARNVLSREGEYWTLEFGGRVTRMKDAKGLGYLAVLLDRPGHEVHVADLIGSTVHQPLGPEGVLDGRARSQYKRRLAELEEDLADAERWHDEGRRALLVAEADFLTRELTSAYGLDGQVRRLDGASERARNAVGARLRATLVKITRHDPALGRHLANSVRTGVFCSYQPERPTRWECSSD